jgi:hypothetical protein
MKRKYVTVMAPRCRDCDRYLNATEEHYYEYRCEDCEKLEMARLKAWKEGAEDLELDERYGK